MKNLDKLKKAINSASEEDLINMVPEMALAEVSSEKKGTVRFVYWLSYMTENDLDVILKQAWQLTKQCTKDPQDTIEHIKNEFGVDIDKIDPDDPDYEPSSITFNDRIEVFEELIGEDNDQVEMFRTIKGLRNDISHLRIHDLEYEDKSLYDLETKRKLIIDYFEVRASELPEPKFFKEMSDEKKKEIENIASDFFDKYD